MLNIRFKDWAKNRPKKHYNRIHDIRVFELLFTNKINELSVTLGEFNVINVYCLADPQKNISIDESPTGEINVITSFDYMAFLALDSVEAKFELFSKLVRDHITPILVQYSDLPSPVIYSYVEEGINEVVKQNYEAVFLVDKTPKKSPSRRKMAILKGIHRSEGFQLRCEVYNDKGLRIINQLLVEEVGNETVYSRFLGTLKWDDENTIVVKSKTSNWSAEIHL